MIPSVIIANLADTARLSTAGSSFLCYNGTLGAEDLTSAGDLMNLSMNTSQDLMNVKRRLQDLRRICERLYNKLGGSFGFLRVSSQFLRVIFLKYVKHVCFANLVHVL